MASERTLGMDNEHPMMRSGMSLIEVVVALALLSAMCAAFVPILIGAARSSPNVDKVESKPEPTTEELVFSTTFGSRELIGRVTLTQGQLTITWSEEEWRQAR